MDHVFICRSFISSIVVRNTAWNPIFGPPRSFILPLNAQILLEPDVYDEQFSQQQSVNKL